MKDIQENDPIDENLENDPIADGNSDFVQGRREAVAKLAYASPLLVGLLFSKNAAAIGSPPLPPLPPRP